MEPIKQKSIREEEAKEILEKMNKETDLVNVENMIKDNKVIFKHKDQTYQVRLLTMLEKEELDELRRKKFGQLIQDKDILMEKDLIRVYKERGIDIEVLNKQIQELESEEIAVSIKLGELLTKKETPESILEEYKNKILNIQYQKNVIMIQKTHLLEFSLETQLWNYVAKLITYLSLDIKNEDKFERCFKTLDTFMDYNDEILISKAASYALCLQYK